jgi:hypothetical protein
MKKKGKMRNSDRRQRQEDKRKVSTKTRIKYIQRREINAKSILKTEPQSYRGTKEKNDSVMKDQNTHAFTVGLK